MSPPIQSFLLTASLLHIAFITQFERYKPLSREYRVLYINLRAELVDFLFKQKKLKEVKTTQRQ